MIEDDPTCWSNGSNTLDDVGSNMLEPVNMVFIRRFIDFFIFLILQVNYGLKCLQHLI